MNGKKIRDKLRYYLMYSPFTWQTFLLLLSAYVIYRLLYPGSGQGTESGTTSPIFMLAAKGAFWIWMAFASLSVVSTLGAWLHYVRLKKQINPMSGFFRKPSERGSVEMEMMLHGAWRPLLGFVKIRLAFEDGQISDPMGLSSDRKVKGEFFRRGIFTKRHVQLSEMKEYRVRTVFVFFEDMFRLVSFPVVHSVSETFYQIPPEEHPVAGSVTPRRSQDSEERIDEMRRMEGAHLNYKSFESGDDIRRIVWKIYAKNRDLVVRIPEIFEPYASKLYVYASFYTGGAEVIFGAHSDEILNDYKIKIWNVLHFLGEKWEIRFVPDQDSTGTQLDGTDQILHVLSKSSWQTEQSLSEYFDGGKGSVLCVSSFSDPVEIQEILNNSRASPAVYFIRGSSVLPRFNLTKLLASIILLPVWRVEKTRRIPWFLSRSRRRLIRLERKIEVVLSGYKDVFRM